jgi:hypothetical protein
MYEYEELTENEEEYIENQIENIDTMSSSSRDSPETILTSDNEYAISSDDDHTMSSDDDYTMTESDIYIYEISELEDDFMDEEKEDGKYYIGLSCLENQSCEFLLMTSVRPTTFFKYTYNIILKFLVEFSLFMIENPVINILKLVKNGERDCVLIKTFWLKIVQRKWKKVFAEKKKTIQQMKTHKWLRSYLWFGKFPNGNYMPGLKGMMNSVIIKK